MVASANTIGTLLHAYLDSQLSEDSCSKVKKYLQNNPNRRIEFEQNQKINSFLHLTFGPIKDRPIPASIDQLLGASSKASDNIDVDDAYNLGIDINQLDIGADPSKPKTGIQWKSLLFNYKDFQSYLLLLMSATTFMIGLFVGYLYPTVVSNGEMQIDATLEKLAIDSHFAYAKENTHAVEMSADEQPKLMNWLSAKLGTQSAPANFFKYGFKLMGGRLLPSNGQHAAFYMYQNSNNERLTLYSRGASTKSNASEHHCKFMSIENITICTWRGETLANYLIGKLDLQDMERLARDAASQLPQ